MSERVPGYSQSRIRWWPVLLGMFFVLCVSAPFILRLLMVASVPIVAEPFDVKAAGRVDVPEGQNAFELYALAATRTATFPPLVNEAYTRLQEEKAPSSIPGELLTFLDSQRAVLELFRQGSERPEAVYHQPESYTLSTLLDVTQQLRQMARLAELEALRLELQGDVAGAWEWHRATLRASRHSGMHGALIERLVGIAIYSLASDGIVRWSARPEVDSSQLRTALDELREVNRKTVPISGPLHVEYLMMQKMLTSPTLRSQVIGMSSEGTDRYALEAQCLLLEPDTSQRTLRLAFTNWLSQCDLPHHERAPTATGPLELFDVPVGGDSGGAGVSAEEVQRLLYSAPLGRLLLPAASQALHAHDREITRQKLLEAALALQVWYREHGEFPESLDPLVGTLLDSVPIDPCGKGEAIRYRREPDAEHGATIWSVGDDGVDNDGRADVKDALQRAKDIITSVKPPLKRAGAAPALR